MSIQLYPLRLPSPPPPLHKPSPRTTLQTTLLAATPCFAKKGISNKVQAQGQGFGESKLSTNKQKSTGGSKDNNGGNDREGVDEEDAIPQEVFDRMLGRIVFFVGFPMASSIGLLFAMGLLKERSVWNVPDWVPFLTILLGFGTSAFGIAYGTLSSSWDPDKEGSLLGWEQAQKNWPELWKEEEEAKK